MEPFTHSSPIGSLIISAWFHYVFCLQLHDGLDESHAGKGGKGPNAANGGNGKGLRMQDIDGALETLVATQEHIRAHKDVETQKVSAAT